MAKADKKKAQREFKIDLVSVTPMLFNSMTIQSLQGEKPDRGKADEWEEEHWLDRCLQVDGVACMPNMAAKQMLTTAASRAGIKIKGKGQQTYTAYFNASLVLPAAIPICPVEELVKDRRVANGNPTKKGGGKIVRVRPMATRWDCQFVFHSSSDLITKAILQEVVDVAGTLIGFSDYRPDFGRFEGTVS